MNPGGRRRPPGPRWRGLGCCVLVLTVLGLWLGTAAGRSPSGGHLVPSVSHAVAMAPVAVRPPLPDADVPPAEFAALAVVLVGLLVRARTEIVPVRVRSERHRGRAPPGGLQHR